MFISFYRTDFSVALSRFMLSLFVGVLAFVGGCGEDNNPIVDDHDHEGEEAAPTHADVDGFVLEVNGAEVYRQFQGDATGGLTVGAGEEIDVHIAFLDPSGAETAVGEEEEEGEDEHGHDEEATFALGLTGYDAAIIEIHLPEAGEDHGEEEHGEEEHGEDAWTFEVVGLKAGATEIKLQLLHDDHPDFTAALLIPVTVQ